jgi:hypothetical protein
MSEQAWLAATDPGEMLDLLARRTGYTGPPRQGRDPRGWFDPVWARKLRLFAVAQSRRLPFNEADRVTCERLVEVTVRYVDRAPPPPPDPYEDDDFERDELDVAYSDAERAFCISWNGFLDLHDIDWKDPGWSTDGLTGWAGGDMALFCAEPDPWAAARFAVELHETLAFRVAAKELMTAGRVSTELDEDEEDPHEALEQRLREAVGPEPVANARAELCGWLREVFGNPFRPPVGAPPESETARMIARGIYDRWDFAGLPVLADALEEAGTTDTAVLAHLREPGPHTRGCWVLDWLLGRPAPGSV